MPNDPLIDYEDKLKKTWLQLSDLNVRPTFIKR